MPLTNFDVDEKYSYHHGFNSYIESEAVNGALPVGQNSPQKHPQGLYTEKFSGTSFTAPRHENKQTWMYRILPSCVHKVFERKHSRGNVDPISPPKVCYTPTQLRWAAIDPSLDDDFVSGLRLMARAGDPTLKEGLGIYMYAARKSMGEDSVFYSADGELLIVPQQGALEIRTELGWLMVRPMEICVLPRGMKYQVRLAVKSEPARGYALELYQGHFGLPELGVIGSNGLANARDFQVPKASFDEPTELEFTITAKFAGRLFTTRQNHTPFDVVAWHGNNYPYKYDLGLFNAMGSISFDHPDPSVFTVLSAPTARPGTAVADFVIFPPRWLVAENTFRPPWYHRNTMSEFMGLIRGQYDAKKGGSRGFQPGGASLHNVMSGHGPDAESYEEAREAEQKPEKVGENSCAFMFESSFMLGVTEWGMRCDELQKSYSKDSWGGLQVYWEKPSGEPSGRPGAEARARLAIRGRQDEQRRASPENDEDPTPRRPDTPRNPGPENPDPRRRPRSTSRIRRRSPRRIERGNSPRP